MRRRRLSKAIAIAALFGAIACASALAIESEIGSISVSSTATMQPRALPSHGGAPVTLSNTTRIKTTDGSAPPTLRTLIFLLDKHGSVNTKGLPTCSMAKLAETTPAQARKRCAGALVGEGTGKAEVDMPGKPPATMKSPLSFFNGPPKGGKPTLIAHAYETIPSPKTLLVPIVIERVKHGRYGFQAKIEVPEIAEGFGSPTLAEANLGRTRIQGGRKVGYLNAYCSGGRLQVYGTLTFSNGDFFPATLTSPCHTPG